MNRHQSLLPLIAALAATLGACSSLPTPVSRPLAVAPAPVTFDGNVTGQATDYVFTLVPDANPAIPGLALQKKGEILRLKLPDAFKRDGQVAIKPDADANLVLTKGWPQAAVKLVGGRLRKRKIKHAKPVAWAVAGACRDEAKISSKRSATVCLIDNCCSIGNYWIVAQRESVMLSSCVLREAPWQLLNAPHTQNSPVRTTPPN